MNQYSSAILHLVHSSHGNSGEFAVLFPTAFVSPGGNAALIPLVILPRELQGIGHGKLAKEENTGRSLRSAVVSR